VTARREAIADQVGAASPGSAASEEFWLVHRLTRDRDG